LLISYIRQKYPFEKALSFVILILLSSVQDDLAASPKSKAAYPGMIVSKSIIAQGILLLVFINIFEHFTSL